MTIVEYRLISKKGEGTFSEVLKAQSIKTGKYVAIKCMKAHFYNIDQVIFIPLNLLGEQSTRDPGFEKTITASQYYYTS